MSGCRWLLGLLRGSLQVQSQDSPQEHKGPPAARLHDTFCSQQHIRPPSVGLSLLAGSESGTLRILTAIPWPDDATF